MKKSGFTVAEVLIALGIIGIVSALTIVALNKFNPDKDKIMYLKSSKALSHAINDLKTNRIVYPTINESAPALGVTDISFTHHPFLNIEAGISPYNVSPYVGDTKLCALLGVTLGANSTSCSDDPYKYDASTFKSKFQNNISFITTNGMRWMVVPAVETSIDTSAGKATFQTDIYVDVNPENNNVSGVDKSCIYDETSCTEPDIFKFMIAADGTIVPADPLGIAYSSSRLLVSKRKYNIAQGATVLNDMSNAETTFDYYTK